MSIDLDQYRRLKQQSDEAKAEVDRSQGALQQLMEKLKEDYDCDTIEQAEKLLQSKERERDLAEKDFSQKLKVFEEKWGEKI